MRKKSEEDKNLQGTARSDRKKSAKGDALKLPRVPKYLKLNTQAKNFYRLFGNALIKAEVLSNIDAVGLAMFAMNLDMYARAVEELEGADLIQEFKSGAKNISAEVSLFYKAQDTIFKYFKFFGATPYHRERILSFLEDNAEVADEDAALVALLKEVNSQYN